jgi:hypothetical protein
LFLSARKGEVFEVIPAGCSCPCLARGHDPKKCTGAEQYEVGGRPGSGAVDNLAAQLGGEPTPNLVIEQFEDCRALLTWFLAWWFGSSDEERIHLESDELSRMRFNDQTFWLRDILRDRHPALMQQERYRTIPENLRKLCKFRDTIAHSTMVNGDQFTRRRRVNATNVTLHITCEEVAEYLDMAFALKSQLWLLPLLWTVQRVA